MNNKDASQTPIKPIILRESEFFGGCIRVKISVKNLSSLAFLDVVLELESDERVLHFDRCEPDYPEKKGKLDLGNIHPNTDRTVAFYLDPLICAKEGTDINCRVSYKDASGKPDSLQMETLKIKVICPIFRTEQEINIGRLKELIEELRFRDSKVYTFPKKVELQEILRSCRDVIQLHDVRYIKTFKTTDEKTYESWYYGKTKVTKKDLVIKCAIRKETESIEVLASGNDPGDIIGLLAELGRNLTKEFEKLGKVQPVFNISIKDSVIQRSNLLSFCDLDGSCGGNVVIEDSLVQRSNIISGNETRFLEERERRIRDEDKRVLKEKEEKERQRIEEEQSQEKHEAFLLKQKREEEQRKVIEERERKAKGEAEGREREKIKQEEERLRRQREEQEHIAKEREEKISEESERRYKEKEKQEDERLRRQIEEQKKIREREEKISEKAAKTLKNKFFAVALVIVLLALGYWWSQIPTQASIHKAIDSIEFVLIPVGEFGMGSPPNEASRRDNEGPVHHVKISNAFYMGKYEVTQKQWRDVMGNNPSNFKGDDLPVEQVSWNDVQSFIKKINENQNLNKYRLPTEAEWEYAARAGTTTTHSFGNDESKLSDYAWIAEDSNSRAHDVGQKKPNPWGLYDIDGNVAEWVQDIYHDSYSGAPIDGSAWEGSGSYRVYRGSCWKGDCRLASRGVNDPGSSYYRLLGFRLLREV